MQRTVKGWTNNVTKVRFKGWTRHMEELQHNLDTLILGTPTSELREKLSELNIQLAQVKEFAKNQTEVL